MYTAAAVLLSTDSNVYDHPRLSFEQIVAQWQHREVTSDLSFVLHRPASDG